MYSVLSAAELTELAKKRFQEERTIDHLEGWFLVKEIQRECDRLFAQEPDCIRIARTQQEVIKRLPLWIGSFHVFAGTQDDSFARSYALINPAFTVDSFSGYCDPAAVFGDIDPTEDITGERIQDLRTYNEHTPYADCLRAAYDLAGSDTKEAIYFVEQVTGHLIPDVRSILIHGTEYVKGQIRTNRENTNDSGKKDYYTAMELALGGAELLAERYADLAAQKAEESEGKDRVRYALMEKTLRKVPREGADNLYEAIQSFLLIWQTMCLEQSPNPFAFSVGNADRIFEPFRAKEELAREDAAALFKHMLVFFNVADRSWAISQNLIIGGRDRDGNDLTNPSSYALLDAYYDMNMPQPILSVKLHKNTPRELYESLGRFFFTPGCLTPSLFNDDSVFKTLSETGGIDPEDLPDYAIAGCQEPLIMGKDNGNTTNSWLNMPKVLELILNDGRSSITGEKLGRSYAENGCDDSLTLLKNIREIFYTNLEYYTDRMAAAANGASKAVSILQVPFLSAMMGGAESGIDTRDYEKQGTKYNGSGCLIHGLSVMADSFTAIDILLEERPQDADRLLRALRTDFAEDEELRQYLLMCPKFGNNLDRVDREAAEIASRVCGIVSSKKNYLGNPFRCDFSTPSTHLLYGYWVGATPDGRNAREMLGYGVDPLYGEAHMGLGFRVLSAMKLPYIKMSGGYASHLGINPSYFREDTMDGKGKEFADKIIAPLFFNPKAEGTAPFYLYVNVTTPEILRKVLDDPKKYAPSGVYIMRIHGTFVNFLDLSPAIQEDIIKRLDPKSASM